METKPGTQQGWIEANPWIFHSHVQVSELMPIFPFLQQEVSELEQSKSQEIAKARNDKKLCWKRDWHEKKDQLVHKIEQVWGKWSQTVT